MRVLRLDLADRSVDLHPMLTVLQGLDDDARRQLVDALAAIPKGRAEVGGLVESHGVLLPLTAETLEILDLAGGADVVVRADDLPGAAGTRSATVEARRALAGAEAALAEAEAELADAERIRAAAEEALATARDDAGADPLAAPRAEHERLAAALADAESARAAAQVAADEAGDQVRRAEAALAEAQRARAEAAAAVAEANAELEQAAEGRDPMATPVLEAAVARLAEAEAALAAVRDGDTEGDERVSDDEVEAWRTERSELEAGILAVETSDPFPIRLAVDQMEAAAAASELVADPTALELADAIEAVEAEIAAAGDGHHGVPDGDQRAAARARLAEAEAAVAAAEAAVRGNGTDRGDAAAIEAAHAAVLEARDAAARRFGGSRGEKRLAAAEAAEAAALEKAGFTSWTDYLMGARGGHGADGTKQVDAARAELKAAADAVRALDEAIAEELRWAALLDRRRELRDAAVELLGHDPGDGIVDALRRHRVPPSETGGLARLRAALEAAGVVLGDEPLPERLLVDLARVWLEEHERAVEERAALERRIAELDVRIAAAERARRNGAGDTAVTGAAAALAAVEEARAAVEAAEARASRNAEAERRVAERRSLFEQAARAEERAAATVAEREAAVLDARDAERAATAALRKAEATLEAARAAEAAAAAALRDLESRLDEGADRVGALEADLARVTAAATAAEERAAACRAERDRAREALEAAEAAEAGAGAGPRPSGEPDVDDVEWFLLARLAAQRAVSLAGSVPLVLDGALAPFGPDSARRLLDRLERVASTVQLVVVSDDPDVAAWASGLGDDRAAVVGAAR